MNAGAPGLGGDGLRCERCGYSLRGIDAGGVCPECSLGVAASRPERRVGTAYQRRARVSAVLPTVAAVVFRPRAVWGVARPSWWASWRLMNSTLAAAGFGYGAGLGLALVTLRPDPSEPVAPIIAVVVLGGMLGLVLFVPLFLLSQAVDAVLMVACKRAGGRADRHFTATVVGHASAGLFAGAMVTVAFGVVDRVLVLPQRVGWIGCAVGAGIGVVWFMLLAKMGYRGLRFANRLAAWEEAGTGVEAEAPP